MGASFVRLIRNPLALCTRTGVEAVGGCGCSGVYLTWAPPLDHLITLTWSESPLPGVSLGPPCTLAPTAPPPCPPWPPLHPGSR